MVKGERRKEKGERRKEKGERRKEEMLTFILKHRGGTHGPIRDPDPGR